MKKPTLKEYIKEMLSLFLTFFKIGLFSFGGGYGMIALISAEVVDRHKWISKGEFGDIIAIAESTPGPISVNAATYIGTLRLGVVGAICATLGVVLPSFIIISALSVIIDLVRDNKWIIYLFKGIRIGVLALILKAALSFFKDMRKTIFSFALAATAFVLVFYIQADVIYVILGTIAICAVLTALTTLYKRKRYHMEGTAEYYCQLVGKQLEKDEYYSKTAVENGVLTVKTIDLDSSDANAHDEGGAR